MKPRKVKSLKKLIITCLLLSFASVLAQAQSVVVTKIINNGSDANKKVFAIVSEGYAAEDQSKFEADIDRLIVNGLFGHDFFLEHKEAFNVYRVDLVSNESGVSTLAQPRDTALKMLYTGIWKQCWMQETALTDTRLKRALANVPRYDYVLVMLNENKFGGCRRGTRLYVTSGVEWDVVAHEYGHAIGDLFDEYWTEQGEHPLNQLINARNCSNLLDRTKVIWKDFLENGTTIPTDESNLLAPLTVGMFPGCNYKSKGIYRPSASCRMRSNTPEFCPVCLSLMKKAVAPYLSNPAGGGDEIATEKYANLLVEANKDGDIQILSVSEIETIPEQTEKEAVGNYIFEIRRDGKIEKTGLLSENPFEIRSFPDPQNKQGEVIGQAEKTTFTLNIRDADYQDLINGKIGIKIFELKKQIALPIDQSPLQQQESLEKLKSKASEVLKLSPEKLSNQMKLLPRLLF